MTKRAEPITDAARHTDARRVPTIWVLTAASLMVSIGAVAFWFSRGGPDPATTAPVSRLPVTLDVSTPEATAETFLDAWRKRDYALALALSAADAKLKVEERSAARGNLSVEEREIEAVWDKLAESRLTLSIRESTRLPDGRRTLHAFAEGAFAGKPYRREMDFTLVERSGQWLVESMRPGPILTEMPRLFEIETSPDKDPSTFKMRGEDVP